MKPLTQDQLFHLYECVKEIGYEYVFEETEQSTGNILKIFYCGSAIKWNTPTVLLIVVVEDPTHEDNDFRNSEPCFNHGNYISSKCPQTPYNHPLYHKYTFKYSIINEGAFNILNKEGLMLKNNKYIKDGPYKLGLDITKQLEQVSNVYNFI